MKKIIYTATIILGAVVTMQSCRDSDLEPTLAQQRIITDAVRSTDDMRATLNGAYDRMSSVYYYGRDYIIYGEVRSDNAYSNANSNKFVTVGQMVMTTNDAYPTDTWYQIYQVIHSANVIANLDLETVSGDVALKNHYLGEALVIRALAHFDLLKLYGQQHVSGAGYMSALGVPYVTELPVGTPITPPRKTVQQVYDLAMADLDRAISLMSSRYDSPSNSHYLSINAAYAIKARIALYFKQYSTALTAAKKVIETNAYNIAESSAFASTFTTDSTKNQIFSIDYNSADYLGNNSLGSIYWGKSYGDIVMLNDLYSKFESTDVRANLFQSEGSAYRNKKYAVVDGSHDVPVIRYEEVILTYAEAALQTGDPTTALTYLNKIPSNRGASAHTSATLDNILLERRKEFAGEGFRFYDLARNDLSLPLVDATKQTYGTYNKTTNRYDTVEYGSYRYAFPIPLREMSANAYMIQNKNY